MRLHFKVQQGRTASAAAPPRRRAQLPSASPSLNAGTLAAGNSQDTYNHKSICLGVQAAGCYDVSKLLLLGAVLLYRKSGGQAL